MMIPVAVVVAVTVPSFPTGIPVVYVSATCTLTMLPTALLGLHAEVVTTLPVGIPIAYVFTMLASVVAEHGVWLAAPCVDAYRTAARPPYVAPTKHARNSINWIAPNESSSRIGRLTAASTNSLPSSSRSSRGITVPAMTPA